MRCSRSDILKMLVLLSLLLSFNLPAAIAQEEEESAEAKQYREDYDRLQKALAVSNPVKRADLLYDLMKERPNSKVFDYAQGNYLLALESLSKAEKFPEVITLAERFIKLRPKVGETYYFYGAALKNEQRYPEAISALAKCAVTKNSAARKARGFLEYIYRAQNNGSLIGLDKVLRKAKAEMEQ
jgi:tetratricopeptide (TPR) repeat protein